MKNIKHIWKYLTSPSYRFFCDLMTSQEVVNRQMNLMKEQMELAHFPPVLAGTIQKYKATYGVETDEAIAIINAKNKLI